MSHTAHFFILIFFFIFPPIKLEIARSEMYHYRICVRRGAWLEGVGDLSATDAGLQGNKACMRSCFPPLNGESMSLGPCVACRLSEVVDLAWPSCIISLLNHVGSVSLWLISSTFTFTCPSRSLFLSHRLSPGGSKVCSLIVNSNLNFFLMSCNDLLNVSKHINTRLSQVIIIQAYVTAVSLNH